MPLAEEREAYRITWEGGAGEIGENRFVYTATMRAADIAVGRAAVTFAVCQTGTFIASPPAMLILDIF